MNYSYGKAKKVMYVGIDGFDPCYAKPLLDAGRLPNIKKFLEKGTTTKDMGMIGFLPSYTPPNWCSMATGAYPGTHGITCYWNHQLGHPLDEMFIGFDSTKCRAQYIHDAFAKEGKKTLCIGWPTTWPPTNDSTILVDGSGIHPFLTDTVDYERFYFCDETLETVKVVPHGSNDNAADCFVTEKVTDLTFAVETEHENENMADDVNSGDGHSEAIVDREYCPITSAKDWNWDVGNAKECIILVNNGLERRYLLLPENADGTYHSLEIYRNKTDKNSKLGAIDDVDQWSNYIYDTMNVNGTKTNIGYRFKIMTMAEDGSKMRLYSSFACDLDSAGNVQPIGLKQEIYKAIGGPIMLSNCGRKDLDEIKVVFESNMASFRWTMDMIDYLLENKEWDLALHGLHIIDISTHVHLNSISAGSDYADLHYEYINKYYEVADEYIGRMLKWLDRGVTIAIGSDHGGLLMGDNSLELGDAWELNIGVMEELGYTVTKMEHGKKVIDWTKTRAIAQRSSYIYINLKGREPHGIVEAKDYDKLVEDIITDLYALKDPKTGRRVINVALNRTDMEIVHLCGQSQDRVGDIFYTMEPDFAHDQGNSLPNTHRKGTSLRCLFALAGPGIKKNHVLNRTVEMVDVVPTLCHLAGNSVPETVDGGVIFQALINE